MKTQSDHPRATRQSLYARLLIAACPLLTLTIGCDKEEGPGKHGSGDFSYEANSTLVTGNIGFATCLNLDSCEGDGQVALSFQGKTDEWIEGINFVIDKRVGWHECVGRTADNLESDLISTAQYSTVDLGGDVMLALWNVIETDVVNDAVNIFEITDTHITGAFQASFVVRTRSRWVDSTPIPDTMIIRNGEFTVPFVDVE